MTTLPQDRSKPAQRPTFYRPSNDRGQSRVAKNATRHGIFSSVPVIPGESLDAWEAHRAGVVASLDPVGLLEVNLAERIALVLWRLQRLARFEAETVTAAMEDVEVPPLPPPDNSIPPLFQTPQQMTREEQLQGIRLDLRYARRKLTEVMPARDCLVGEAEAEQGNVVPYAVVATILEAALGRAEIAENVRARPTAVRPQSVPEETRHNWYRRGEREMDAGPDPPRVVHLRRLRTRRAENFIEAVRTDMRRRAEEGAGGFPAWNASRGGSRRLDGGIARRRAAKRLPSTGGKADRQV